MFDIYYGLLARIASNCFVKPESYVDQSKRFLDGSGASLFLIKRE